MNQEPLNYSQQPPMFNHQQPKRNNSVIIIAIICATVIILGVIGFFAVRALNAPAAESADTEAIAGVEYNFPGDATHPDSRFHNFDWLSDRKVTSADLSGLSAGDLRLLRNAIFAMHGYRFKDVDLADYFGRFEWYEPRFKDVSARLSKLETDNVAFIQRYEGGGKTASTESRTSGNAKAALTNVGFTRDYSDIMCYTRLDPEDLEGLSKGELRILRNTIYARHGRRFKSADLDTYFRHFSWYVPTCDEVSPNALSPIERHNISLIQQYE